ncbi:MAG: hypothetical protein WC220_10890, partial [Pedobacter sp.]
QGSKSLTGDSLFYDRKAGLGRAIGNIIFIDTAEKAQLRGGIGLYHKSDESILVTKNPYVVIISESDSAKVDSIWMTADTLYSKVVFTRDLIPYKKEEMIPDDQLAAKGDTAAVPMEGLTDPPKPLTANTIDRASNAPDPVITPPKVKEPEKIIIPPDKERPVLSAAQKPPAKSKNAKALKKNEKPAENSKPDTIKPPVLPADSVSADTAKTRIVIAYHHAKIFKSDLQARADSMFFSYSDSTVRCFVNPMIWAQGSQLSGDTVFLQMKNKKLDNMLLQHNSFIVNTEDADSSNFNQIKGKMITGYFRDNKLNSMFVDGNAESVYYLKEDTVYSGLNHLVSGRLKIMLKENKLQSITAIRSIDASITPMADLKEEEKVLKGFIWKPRDRPKSKEEIIPQLTKPEIKPAVSKTSQSKTPAKTSTKVPAKTPSKTQPESGTKEETKDQSKPAPKTGTKQLFRKQQT